MIGSIEMSLEDPFDFKSIQVGSQPPAYGCWELCGAAETSTESAQNGRRLKGHSDSMLGVSRSRQITAIGFEFHHKWT